jgi:hypothetical protein
MSESESEAWRHIEIARKALQEMSAIMTRESQDKFIKEIQILINIFNNLSPNVRRDGIENQIDSMISEGYTILDKEHETKRELLATVQGKNYRQTSKLRKRRNVNYTNALPKENLKILRNSKRRRKGKATYNNNLFEENFNNMPAAAASSRMAASSANIVINNNENNNNNRIEPVAAAAAFVPPAKRGRKSVRGDAAAAAAAEGRATINNVRVLARQAANRERGRAIREGKTKEEASAIARAVRINATNELRPENGESARGFQQRSLQAYLTRRLLGKRTPEMKRAQEAAATAARSKALREGKSKEEAKAAGRAAYAETRNSLMYPLGSAAAVAVPAAASAAAAAINNNNNNNNNGSGNTTESELNIRAIRQLQAASPAAAPANVNVNMNEESLLRANKEKLKASLSAMQMNISQLSKRKPNNNKIGGRRKTRRTRKH